MPPVKKSTKSLKELCFDKITNKYGTVKQRIPLLRNYYLVNEIFNRGQQIDKEHQIFDIDTFINRRTTDLTGFSCFLRNGVTPIDLLDHVANVCKNLSCLYLPGNISKSVESMANLLSRLPGGIRCLYLCDNDWITDDLMATIGTRCRRLQELDMRFCKRITNQGIYSLCRNGDMQIEKLSLSCTEVTKEGYFYALQHLPKLKRLDHNYSGFLPNVQRHIESSGSLPTYGLEETLFYTDIDIRTIQFDVGIVFPRLQTLEISSYTHENDDHLLFELQILQNAMKGLRKLNLSGFDRIDFVRIAARCPVLESLVIYGCNLTVNFDGSEVSDENLRLLENMRHLQKLLIEECNSESDVLAKLLDNNSLRQLTDLKLYSCDWVTVRSLYRLIDSDCPLNTLHVENCRKIIPGEVQNVEKYVARNNFELSITNSRPYRY